MLEVTEKTSSEFLVCQNCKHVISTRYVYCPYCGVLVVPSVQTALMNLKNFVQRKYRSSEVSCEEESTLTNISDIGKNLNNPEVAVKFVIDYITFTIDGYMDSLNVIKELNFMDTLSLVREAKADYERAMADPEESTYYLRKARNNLECFRGQLLDKLPCLIRRLNEIENTKNPFKSGSSISDLKAYCPLIKESICRIAYSAILDISVAKSLGKKNIDYLLDEYHALFEMLPNDTIDLLLNYDPEKDHEFYKLLPQVKSDIKILAEYTTKTIYKELTE